MNRGQGLQMFFFVEVESFLGPGYASMDNFLLVMLNFILQEHMDMIKAMGAGLHRMERNWPSLWRERDLAWQYDMMPSKEPIY